MSPSETALTRAMVYRWFSMGFRESSIPLGSAEGFNQLLLALPGFNPATIPSLDCGRLAAEYKELFSHNLTPDSPPYETQYGSAHIFLQSQQLADISGFYRAFGVELNDLAHERVDHIAVELEFISFLAFKEAYALQSRREGNVGVVQEAQKKFLRDHLARWVGAFVERIRMKLPNSTYASLAATLREFVEWDCQRCGIQPERLSFNMATQVEPSTEEGCFGSGSPGCA